ncbi:MAG: hypothetical protein FJ395_20925 [Verrucomicrobia bacterium]|nr:hypothetical protein [Verrucomicrobiota bacterium]
MKKIIIKVQYGGLGDHLFFSHIPALAKKIDLNTEVLVSNHSPYRNPETKRLVWKLNPHVDGFTDEDAPSPNFASVPEGKNLLDVMADFFGLDDGMRNREPEIYYQPQLIPELQGKLVYDPNYITNCGHPSIDAVRSFLSRTDSYPDLQMKILSENNKALSGIKPLEAKSLEHLCDIIFSCEDFLCMVSGAAALSAAINKRCVALWTEGVNPMFLFSKRIVYYKL